QVNLYKGDESINGNDPTNIHNNNNNSNYNPISTHLPYPKPSIKPYLFLMNGKDCGGFELLDNDQVNDWLEIVEQSKSNNNPIHALPIEEIDSKSKVSLKFVQSIELPS